MLPLSLWQMLILLYLVWLVSVLSNYVLRATLLFDVVVLIVVILFTHFNRFTSLSLSLSLIHSLLVCVCVRACMRVSSSIGGQVRAT